MFAALTAIEFKTLDAGVSCLVHAMFALDPLTNLAVVHPFSNSNEGNT